MKPEDLLPTIQECFSDNLESIVLYGSAASGHFQPPFSNYNLLILLKKEIQSNPLAGSKTLKKWLKTNPPPLLWDLPFFQNSVDVFPLEFLEIQQHHRVLYGKSLPPFEVHLKNLRHQLEMELRAKYLALQNNPSLMNNLGSWMTLFNGILTLLKKTTEEDWRKRVEQLAQRVEFHPEVFLSLIEIRQGKRSALRKNEVQEVWEAFLTELRTIIRFIDRLELGGTTRPAHGGTPSP